MACDTGSGEKGLPVPFLINQYVLSTHYLAGRDKTDKDSALLEYTVGMETLHTSR